VADKDFVVKHGLVVGDTATINGVQIDPSGATSGKVLKFDGTKFAPASEGDISGTVYSATIGDGTSSSYVITHGFGTRNVVVVIRNAASPYEVIQARWEATTTNTITVDFSAPIASETVIVSVYGAVTGISTGSSYYQTIGNGTDSSFTLAHNFNTRDVVVTARNATSPYEVINVRWEAETANTVIVDFSSPPSSNSIRIGVYATVSGTAVTTIDDLSDITITSPTSGDFLKWNGTAWVNQSGVVNTGDTGTVTSTMIANGTIVDADINASAAIAYSKLANASAGQILLGTTTTGVITATAISGDITINGAGVATISANSVALGTDTTGDYVSSLVAGTGITLANNSGEGATPTITVNTSVIAALDSPTLTGTPLAPTAANTTNNTQIATTAYVKTVIGDLINSAPAALDTLGEIATSLANNESLSSTLTSSIALKAPLANPTFTGTVTLPDNTVALGTKTTGDYVSSLVAGTGITLSNNSGEGTTPTIAIGQSVATSATPTFASITTTASNGLIVNYASGDEGGEILLAKPITNTSISGTGILVDVYQNRLRLFEAGGSARGAFIDLTTTGAGVTSPIALSQSTGNSTSPVFTNLTVNGSLKITTALEIASVSATAATGTINIDFLSNPVVYYTANATANWTLNIRGNNTTTMNTVMSTGDVATVTFMAQQGATAYYPTVYQIDGTAVTPKWQGGTAPTSGNASSIDTYAVTVVKTAANTYTAFASQTKFA